jgi:nucleotide-binding universal stress UspA family protein
MSGVILAVPDRPEAAPGVLAAAAQLAELTRAARISVLLIRTPPSSTIMPTEEVLTPRAEARIRQQEAQRSDAVKQAYDAWALHAQATGLATTWDDIEALADRLVDEWGRRVDFIVLRRPVDHQRDQERRALHAALFDTGRPVLAVPPETRPSAFGRRIAIAWRDDPRTVKAVLSGLRCAARADEIHVLAGTRDPAAKPRLPAIFEEHGIVATLHVLPITGQQVFGASLLAEAHRLGADMLMMGAFARHPVRSVILGGVTRHMLSYADVPVLMRH